MLQPSVELRQGQIDFTLVVPTVPGKYLEYLYIQSKLLHYLMHYLGYFL